MRYFVTGATGFVGGRVTRQLLAASHEVVIVVRSPEKARDLAELGARVERGDVTDRESMRSAMRGSDGVFHIAGWYKVGVRDTSAAVAINVEGTRNVLELMRDLEIPKGVYTSTLAVNSDTHGQLVDESYHYSGPHLSVYDETKWRAHYEVADPLIAAGLPLTIVQPGLIYGPGDTSSARMIFVQYLQGKLPVVPLQTAFSWAHIDDIAHGHILAFERGQPGASYIIGGPVHTVIDALQIAEEITGIPAPRVRATPAMLRTAAGLMSLIEKVVPVPEDYSAEYLRVSAGVTYIGDNSKARRELGYTPRALREGLSETLQHEMRLLGMTVPAGAGAE